jgi:hypothetical protein
VKHNQQLEHILKVLLDINSIDTQLEHEHQIDVTDTRTANNKYIELNKAFLKILSGAGDTSIFKVKNSVSDFYKNGIAQISNEIETKIHENPDLRNKLHYFADPNQNKSIQENNIDPSEKFWSIFFPEGTALKTDINFAINNLRNKRKINITHLNPNPISNPITQILFTSNVLLTVPLDHSDLSDSNYSLELKDLLKKASGEKQLYWYDHPIPVGIEPEKNEVLYGMRGLDQTVAFEKERGHGKSNDKLTCILSASVTHDRLHQIAKPYLEEEFGQTDDFKHLNIFVFTETDTDKLTEDVLAPAAEYFLGISQKEALDSLRVFGVDGEYGRHYSFLKAISAFWQIFIDPVAEVTFKIDLDQVFPEDNLVEETGNSAFEHLMTPLWGARGIDQNGNPVELGMIAGALVNQKDIDKSIFTPDIPIPHDELEADEHIFYSKLPQAISTQAEMMTRYTTSDLDGRSTCIQRVHVTGGTNGIRIDSLLRHRPFTPSFFGRAEDQAYIMSLLNRKDQRLAYAHKDGLIMRHDKKAFAQEAIQAASVGKLVGDYIRILLFSAYAKLISDEITNVKELLDPFTGCFISQLPVTVVYLRFALKAAEFEAAGKIEEAAEFIKNGTQRIYNTLDFIQNEISEQYRREKKGWELYFDVLEKCKAALNKQDKFALKLRKTARQIVSMCHIQTTATDKAE